jgi:sulfopyruvate decarboxylase alpha subunit
MSLSAEEIGGREVVGPHPHSASPHADIIFEALTGAGVQHVTYVPDAGHARLIGLFHAASDVQTTVLTTEEEGVAIGAGAWAGGARSVLLMQSSGVGNCINMLSLISSCRLPFLTIVTMRGEWGEFNPWQIPMGSGTPEALKVMGVRVLRVDAFDDLASTMASATTLAFDANQAVAVLLSQKFLGRKQWTK